MCRIGLCVSAGRVKNGALKSGVFTDVVSNFNLMVNDDIRARDWAPGRPRNKLEPRIIASTEWCCWKNIPAIHTLISDDDTLMKIKDDEGGDNYEEQNDEVEDVAIRAAGFPAFVWILRANMDASAIWSLMVHYGISRNEHKASLEMYFIISLSGPAPSFMVFPICIYFLSCNFPFMQYIYHVFTSASVHSSVKQNLVLKDSFC